MTQGVRLRNGNREVPDSILYRCADTLILFSLSSRRRQRERHRNRSTTGKLSLHTSGTSGKI
jgi:hypothetical protein